MDTDILFLRDPALLWALFDQMSDTACLALSENQSGWEHPIVTMGVLVANLMIIVIFLYLRYVYFRTDVVCLLSCFGV